MRRTLEREVKLVPREGFVLPPLGGRPLEPRLFVSTYHDTTDLRLARVGITLRHRVEDGRGVWQLKLPRGRARDELESDGGPASPPAELARLLTAVLRGRSLEPVARLRTRRSGVRVRSHEGAADVVLDHVALLEGQRETRSFDELEVELREGGDEVLRPLVKALRKAGAAEDGALTKLARALGVPGVEESAAPTGTAEALQAAFGRQLAQIVAHDPGTRLGLDAEDVHQHRVATRRLRAFLRSGRPVLDREWADGLRIELGRLGRELGRVRDLDVLLESLRDEARSLEVDERAALSGVLGRLERERDAARTALVAALDEDWYMALLDRLEAAAAAPRLTGTDVPLCEPWLAELKRLRRAAAALPAEPGDEALHELRIRVKRARYAAELAGPALGKRGERFVAAAKALQDVLGEHQDAVVAEERIRSHLGGEPNLVHLAAGRMVERLRERRAGARAEWRGAWKTLDRRGRAAAKL